MNAQPREFTDSPADRRGYVSPLIIGITGPSFSGKTWSALRLATGIQRVTGGEIFGIDTESSRMRHYGDFFKFRHVSLAPPHSSNDYRGAIDYCVGRGAKIIIIDQMSSEHDGEGGVLDQMEQFLDSFGDDEEKRHKNLMRSTIKPKREQKKLTRHIVELAAKVTFIILYRAEDKVKPPKKGGPPEAIGWQPVTTSTLPYEMTVRFLLAPGSDGVPTLIPATNAERLSVKNPEQFKGWFKKDEPLSEDMGERLAKWAAGGAGGSDFEVLIEQYEKCEDTQTFDQLEVQRAEIWKRISPFKAKLKAVRDAADKRLRSVPPDDTSWIEEFRGHTSISEIDKAWEHCISVYKANALQLPLTVEDAYTLRREFLVEQEGKQE